MASINTKNSNRIIQTAKAMASSAIILPNTTNRLSDNTRNHHGTVSYAISDLQELRRTVLSCMLWEDGFYESGKSVSDRIAELVPKIDPSEVVRVAYEARTLSKLRHVPLFITVEMLKYPEHKKFVRRLVPLVVQRADEMAELLSMYWKNELAANRDIEGKYKSQRANKKIPMQLLRGIRDTFVKFDDYQLTKYLGNDKPVRMADVIRIVHPDPKLAQTKLRDNKKHVNMAEVYKSISDGTARAPQDTWEVSLSAAGREGKKKVFEDLLDSNKLPAMALLRNLRGMLESGVQVDKISNALDNMRVERVLPYRFITARKYALSLSKNLEQAMFKCIEGTNKLPGKTVLLIDNSGSMSYALSGKSEMTRVQGATGLAILAKEICESSETLLFDNFTYAYSNGSYKPVNKPNNVRDYYGYGQYREATVNRNLPASETDLRGFALQDAITGVPQGGTDLRQAIDYINNNINYDRLIVFTDEQSSTIPNAPKGKGYIINVANYQNGIGYGPWVHIDGFSESVLAYITEYEKEFG